MTCWSTISGMNWDFRGAARAVAEEATVDIATGAVKSALVSADQPEFTPVQPKELRRLFRNHWSIENTQHHVRRHCWDEDVRTLRRTGLGEVFATLADTAADTALNARRLEDGSPQMSLPLRAKTCAFRQTQAIAPLRSGLLTLQSSC